MPMIGSLILTVVSPIVAQLGRRNQETLNRKLESSMVNAVIDSKSGIVQYPHLHDATLISLALEPTSARFRFQTVTKQVVCLVLHDVRGLSVESLFENNIVFEIQIAPTAKMEPEDFRRVLHLSTDHEINSDKVDKLRAENFVFVRINPTLGADVLAICREAAWEIEA